MRDPARRRWALAAAPVALALTATAVGFGLARDRRADPDAAPVAAPTSRPAIAFTSTGPVVAPTTTVPAPPELPRGGRRLFPRHRVVGF
jgi:hypothetical protein